MTGKLLKLPEVAAYLGVPVGTLQRWRLQGRGPRMVKIGTRLFARQSDVDAWIAGQFESVGGDHAAAS